MNSEHFKQQCRIKLFLPPELEFCSICTYKKMQEEQALRDAGMVRVGTPGADGGMYWTGDTPAPVIETVVDGQGHTTSTPQDQYMQIGGRAIFDSNPTPPSVSTQPVPIVSGPSYNF